MLASPDLDSIRASLACRWPWVGAWRRRKALALLDARREEPWAVPLLAQAADVAGAMAPREAETARTALRAVSSVAAVDALCEEALRSPGRTAEMICLERGLRPSDPERACLFLFLTGQLDAYFEQDFEFQGLRLEYDRADAPIQARVLRGLRGGDARCLGFFGSRKKLSECNEREIQLALQSFRKHGDWPRLFQAFLELPLRHGIPILRELRRSGWLPDDTASHGLLVQALAWTKGQIVPESRRSVEPCAPLERWLDAGRNGPLSRLDEAELLERLATAPPAEGVSIAAAIAARPAPSFAAQAALSRSPHWLVRLAARLLGVLSDLTVSVPEEKVQWAAGVAPAYPILDVWPAKCSPAHLETLARAAPDVWEGGLGAARRVLEGLIAYRVTAGSFEELVVEPEDFAATFEPVTGDGDGHVETGWTP